MDTVFFCATGLIFALLLAVVLRGPSLWDRLIAANLCVTITAMGIMFFAVFTGSNVYLDSALAFILTGFVGTQFFSGFISRKGKL